MSETKGEKTPEYYKAELQKIKARQEYEEENRDSLREEREVVYLSKIDRLPYGRRVRQFIEGDGDVLFHEDLCSICEVIMQIPIGNNAKKKYVLPMIDVTIKTNLMFLADIYNVVDITVDNIETTGNPLLLFSFGEAPNEKIDQLQEKINELLGEIEDKQDEVEKLREEQAQLQVNRDVFEEDTKWEDLKKTRTY